MNLYVDVILPLPLDAAYTYLLPKEFHQEVIAGARVAVPFGTTKVHTAIIISIHSKEPQLYEAKEVYQLLDSEPLITQEQLKHWQWLANYYMCSFGEVLRSALPSVFLVDSETVVTLERETELTSMELKDEEYQILEALDREPTLRVKEVEKLLDSKKVLGILKGMEQSQLIRFHQNIQEKYVPKYVQYLALNEAFAQDDALNDLLLSLQNAAKQREALLTFFQMPRNRQGRIPFKALVDKLGGRNAIDALVKKEILIFFKIQEDRVNYTEANQRVKDIGLSTAQENALKSISLGFEQQKPVLMHGVTGSGKTEIFIKLIDQVLMEGKQVLYLMPEIALTTQIVGRLQTFFGNQLVVYHSRYTQNERAEVWFNVKANKPNAKVIIGARSSIFLPFQDLGLIVIDEEHDNSYKQYDPAPRYHGRDSALYLASLWRANCVLGSATPSLETFLNAKKGKYGYTYLGERYGKSKMPDFELVDLKKSYKKNQMKGHFSDFLIDQIKETVETKNTVILFQNRRGYAPVVQCIQCGAVNQCPHCDVSLTYHQHLNKLKCHYCGYHEPVPLQCGSCSATEFDHKGLGTEQVELELSELFPDYRIARMDLDTTKGKHNFHKIINDFESGQIDVLVGTQMVTKGLDFGNVGLVGVMHADSLLHHPNYNALERCFQLLVQVAGRAGRGGSSSKIVVQAFQPNHPIIQLAMNQDYLSMARQEYLERKVFKYPPLVKLIRITLKHKDYAKLSQSANWWVKALNMIPNLMVLGPEVPPVSRIRRDYLLNIVIKSKINKQWGDKKNSIKKIEKSFNAIPIFKSVKVIYHVDHI